MELRLRREFADRRSSGIDVIARHPRENC